MVYGEIVDPVILEGRQLGRVGYFQNNLMRRCTIIRFGLVLLVFMFAISLGGCGSMCGPKKVAAETPAPVQVVQKAPEPVRPAPPPPPPKKDRN